MGTIVTGSGPHSGDADTPNRMGFDLRTVAWLHADMVLLFIGLLIGLIVAIHLVQSPARTRTLAWVLFAITVIQGLIGYTQYFTGVPWLLVTFHVVGAAVLWVVVVFLLLSMQDRGHVVASGQERIRSNYEK
jgi:cytochrome c oxidase assembly protein subunit 15